MYKFKNSDFKIRIKFYSTFYPFCLFLKYISYILSKWYVCVYMRACLHVNLHRYVPLIGAPWYSFWGQRKFVGVISLYHFGHRDQTGSQKLFLPAESSHQPTFSLSLLQYGTHSVFFNFQLLELKLNSLFSR